MADEDKVKVRIAVDPDNDANVGKVKTVTKAEARQLVHDGWAAYIDTDAKSPYDGKSVTDLLNDVGDDAVKAAELLDWENTQDVPRTTLVGPLEAVIEAAAEAADDAADTTGASAGQTTTTSVTDGVLTQQTP